MHVYIYLLGTHVRIETYETGSHQKICDILKKLSSVVCSILSKMAEIFQSNDTKTLSKTNLYAIVLVFVEK